MISFPVVCATTALVVVALVIPSGAHAEEDLKKLSKVLQKEFLEIVIQDSREQRRSRPDVFKEKFESLFGQYMDRQGRSGLDSKELRILHSAVDSLAFYVKDADTAERLAEISNEIESRDSEGNKSHLAETYEELIEARLFVAADKFADKYRGKVIPESFEWMSGTTSYSGPTVITVERKGRVMTLTRKAANIADGAHVIVAAHPGCGFCKRAIEYIENDEKLAPAFMGNAQWVATQGATIPLGSIVDWNQTYDFADLVISYKDSEWPEEIVFSRTPIFYFLVNGKVVYRVVGWQGEQTASELLTGFEMLKVGKSR